MPEAIDARPLNEYYLYILQKGRCAMKKRTKTSWFEKLIAKALIWVASKALESAPVIGPIFKVIMFVNDLSEARRSYGLWAERIPMRA